MRYIENNDCAFCAEAGSLCNLLHGCTPTSLEVISRKKRRLYFKKGSTVLPEGRPSNGIYFISSGKVMVYKPSTGGSRLILRFLKKGDAIGYHNISDDSVQTHSVKAIETTTLCFIPRDRYQQLLPEHPDLAFSLLMQLEKDMNLAEDKCHKIAHYTVKQLIADTLIYLFEVYGYLPESTTLNVFLSREEIADVAGTTKEQVSKVLSEFKSKDLIFTKGKRIDILHPEALRNIAGKINV